MAECARPRAQQAPNSPMRPISSHLRYFPTLLRLRTGALRQSLRPLSLIHYATTGRAGGPSATPDADPTSVGRGGLRARGVALAELWRWRSASSSPDIRPRASALLPTGLLRGRAGELSGYARFSSSAAGELDGLSIGSGGTGGVNHRDNLRLVFPKRIFPTRENLEGRRDHGASSAMPGKCAPSQPCHWPGSPRA